MAVNFASKVLQKKNIDISESVTVLEQVEKNLTELRSSYGMLMIEATELANKWNIQPEPEFKNANLKLKNTLTNECRTSAEGVTSPPHSRETAPRRGDVTARAVARIDPGGACQPPGCKGAQNAG
ncbi:unnamed protein product [Acanthoscelides obtectus]|uniref:Uncharacterized protein n=1 Tax=Acanthoscelides obtectus TaxID=200917 RepID=A0A9P0PKT8_ACAOB|nr:unnamed protein product [Acanthoscelides obtectus]CAK1675359.1 hypothetical protein AOBTE_LOCUS30162 [Acanthoscelides obtectus]